jgi:hypothetical protein
MDTPRSPDERPGDPSGEEGWHEPAHLGPQEEGAGPVGPPAAELPAGGAPARPGPAGPRRGNPVLEAFTHRGDPWGVQGWALGVGWEVSDGTAPRDAVLAEVLAGSPLRVGKDARPSGVVRGRAGTLELVAFDVVEPLGRRWVPRFGITAAPLLAPPPYFRLTPARFWKHRTGGLLQLPSGDPAFDTRWTMLVAEDAPPLRRLVQDPTLRELLLATDDGDEFWTAAGHVAVVRPDGQRPDLVEHHARLLGAVVAALSTLD